MHIDLKNRHTLVSYLNIYNLVIMLHDLVSQKITCSMLSLDACGISSFSPTYVLENV